MTRYRFLPIFLLLLTLLSGCVRNEFRVEVALPDSLSTCTFIYYASDPKKGWLVENVVHLQKGKGKLEGKTRNPSLIFVLDHSSRVVAVGYAERGDKLSLSGKSQSGLEWELRGNKITDALTDWRLANLQALKANDPERVNKAVEKFVGENPENPVSTILLEVYFYRGEAPQLFSKLWKSLKGKAADSKWVEIASRSDMIDGAPSETFSPRPFAVKSFPLGCDTLKPGSLPTLLLFSRPEAEGYDADINVLRDLLKANPDSSARIIARFDLRPDSLAMTRTVKADSLRNVVEAWMPLGLADPDARQLGVNSVPCVLVVAKGGKLVYRGPDLLRAVEEFNKIKAK